MHEWKYEDTSKVVLFYMVDSTDHVTEETGLTVTVTISKNGGSFAAAAGTVAEVGNGLYKLTPTSADVGTLGAIAFRDSATGADSCMVVGRVVYYDPYDAVRLGMTALPNAAANAAGGLPISEAGGLDLDGKLANTDEITAARMGALTDWLDGGRLDLLIDAILVDTGTTIPATLATIDGKIDTVDGIVDDILVDTGTTIPGTLSTIDGIVDAILVDTGTTLPATLTTIEGKIDTVDGIVDNILVDTGTTLPGTLSTIDGIVDAILVDTGTTIPNAISGLNDIDGTGLEVDVVKWKGTALSDPATAGYPDVNIKYISGSSTAADNAEVVFDTDFATNYDTANDRWEVDTVAISGSTTAANNAEIVYDTDFSNNYDTDNDRWKVQAEVQAVIETNHLDHLFAAAYDPASKPGVADALLNELIGNDAGESQFTANALELAPTGGSAPSAATIAASVWEYTTRSLTDTDVNIITINSQTVTATSAITVGPFIGQSTALLTANAAGAVDSLIQGFLDNTIAETTPDNISTNFETFFDNADTAPTTKVVDNVGAVVAGGGATSDKQDEILAAIEAIEKINQPFEDAVEYDYVVVDDESDPIADVLVIAKSSGVTVQTRRTDSTGTATFSLQAGTYDFYSIKSGYNFTNPDTETVS